MADLDAVNLAMLSKGNEDIFNVWSDYFAGIENGTINRASEFASNLGNGDIDTGKKSLEKEVGKFVKSQNKSITIGDKTYYYGKRVETATATMFLDNILNENNELDN